MNAISESVISQLTSEDGTFDYVSFKEIMKDLSDWRAEHKGESEAAIKVMKEAEAEEAADRGKAYYESLSVGDAISWNTADGVRSGVVAEAKANAKQAHVVLDGLPARSAAEEGYEGKFGDRYVKWEKIIVPNA